MAGRLLTLLAVLALAVPAGAQLASKRRELSKIQDELKQTLGELERLRAEEKSLDRDVQGLRSRDAGARRRLEDLQAGIRRAETRRAELRARLDAAGKVAEFWTAALASEAARHRAASSAAGDAWSSREIWAEEYRRAAMIDKARHLRGLQGFSRSTEKAAEESRRRAGDLQEGRRRAQAEREAALREYEEKRAALERAQERAAAAAARAKELEASARALTALIDKLGRKPARRGAAPPARLEVPRNSLPWPAPGRVVRPFGREKDPELGTWTVRQGLLVATPPRAPVAAVADGRVIFSGPFRSYGRVVIVEHGGSFFSVYGELGESSASKGDAVRAGQAIAVSGGGEDEGRYYLELRRGAEALDPAHWLKKP